MSELFPKVPSDEIDHEHSLEDTIRDAEIAGDKPPHHDE
jgi:hypothetical protein